MSLNEKRKQETASKKSIIAWLNEQHAEGKEISIKWEGGGDSGWVYFDIDGDTTENEYTEAIVNRMYENLDYGSWAGEFNAQGEAVYSPETRCFEGIDYYGEDANDVVDVDIKFNVPKHLWFETVHVECECYYDETPNISVRFILKNGFLSQEHSDICSNLQGELQSEFSELFSNYSSVDGSEFRGCNDSWILNRTEAEEQPDGTLLFTISKVDVGTVNNEEKSVVLELDEEFVKDIDEQLNS